AGAGDAVARKARGVRAEARRGDELPGDGGSHRGAHSHAQDASAPRPGSAAQGIGGTVMNPIDPRIHRALDGEIPREALPPELRRVVERLESAAALLASAPEGGRSVADRLLARLSLPARSPLRRLARALPPPRPAS